MAASHIFDTPPEGVASDWTMPQNWAAFTPEQHATWRMLFDRQVASLDGYACRSFLGGLDILRGLGPGVPDFAELNARLGPVSGWEIVAVPGWIPNRPFFEHLASRRFPAANFLRPPEQIAYSEEPDMFHDIFGHVPMLTDPAFADFLVAYGEAGLRAEKLGASDYLGRLWLYTVEFGLVVEEGQLRAFGGGLLSSLAETAFALTASEPRRLWLDIERVMRTRYHFDAFQQTYFVVAGFEQLLAATEEADFASLYSKIADEPALAPGDAWCGDVVYDGGLPTAPPRLAGGEASI
ncbi:MAG: phenylalanine 4-monooxygenase [Sphingopyxis sp.]|uniref:phenylalanine 4-monooxygenase n=1 Tax=Sphingopyxis sp. TaxID=1908224 RepID=UPI0032EB715C